MKVEVEKQEKFKPIKLTLTIESEEELKALLCMCDYNVTIPNLVENRSLEIKTFLDLLSYQLINNK